MKSVQQRRNRIEKLKKNKKGEMLLFNTGLLEKRLRESWEMTKQERPKILKTEIKTEIVNPIPKTVLSHIVNLYETRNLYKLEKIGKGGYGHVFAYGEYAIKYIYDTDNMDYACNDAKVLKEISHLDSIPTLYAVIDDRLLIVERIIGRTVSDYVNIYENPYNVNESILDQWKNTLIDILKLGYSPYDLHESNVIIDVKGNIKIVDVGFFKKHGYSGDCLDYYHDNAGYSTAQEWTGEALRQYIRRIKKVA